MCACVCEREREREREREKESPSACMTPGERLRQSLRKHTKMTFLVEG